MDKKPPIVNRIIDDERAGIFHSSAYGRAQSGDTMGAASTESFSARQKVERNRKTIRNYRDSLVAEQRFKPPEWKNAEAGDSEQQNKADFWGVGTQGSKSGSGSGSGRTAGAKKAEEGPANLYVTAEKRAEMSAKFAGRTNAGPGAKTGSNRGGASGARHDISGVNKGSSGLNRGSLSSNRGSLNQNRGGLGSDRGGFEMSRGISGINRGVAQPSQTRPPRAPGQF